MTEEIVLAEEVSAPIAQANPHTFMAAMSSNEVLIRHSELRQFAHDVLKADVDYGTIPGTGTKPTLLKPGAEKLCTYFGLSVKMNLAEKIEDWTGKDHNKEPFFYFRYTAALYRGDTLIAETDASCNSWEKKYRYRQGERVCPECGAAAIIKGREEYGGGWLCFKKKDGCGAKFDNGDSAIEGQDTAKMPNPDIADQVNTIQKMAQKRALIGSTLIGVNASEFFTQDIEDMAQFNQQRRDEAPRQAARPQQSYSERPPTKINKTQIDTILGFGTAYYEDRGEGMSAYIQENFGCQLREITFQQAEQVKESFTKALRNRDGGPEDHRQHHEAAETQAEAERAAAAGDRLTDAQHRAILAIAGRVFGRASREEDLARLVPNGVETLTKAEASGVIDQLRGMLGEVDGR